MRRLSLTPRHRSVREVERSFKVLFSVQHQSRDVKEELAATQLHGSTAKKDKKSKKKLTVKTVAVENKRAETPREEKKDKISPL